MTILEKMKSDLEKLKQLSIQNDQFKQEYLALLIVVEDYEACTSPRYVEETFNITLKPIQLEIIKKLAFEYADKLLINTLNYYYNNEKELFRDTYLKRLSYSLRMLTYYARLHNDDLFEYNYNINYLDSEYPLCHEYLYEDLYFFSDSFNRFEEALPQTTTYDDSIIDIEAIMDEDEARMYEHFEKETNENKAQDEYIAFGMAINDYRSYKDENFLLMNNVKIESDFPILDYFNLALQGLEKQLAKYIVNYESWAEVYIKRHTYALRILSYYYATYMKASYQDIIETYERLYPYAKKYWHEPLYFLGSNLHNIEPFKPRCPHCGTPYTSGISEGHVTFCSEPCALKATWLSNQFNLLSEISGLNEQKLAHVLRENKMSLDQFTAKLDEINDVIDKGIAPTSALLHSFHNAETYNTLYNNLKNYNVMRGGKNGFKGFVFEELHATASTVNGTTTKVLGSNQIADFMVLDANGKISYAQAKAGYKGSPIDFKKYEGQTLIVDKGNVELKLRAEKAGLSVIESPISLTQSKKVADIMQLEKKVFEKVTGQARVNAPITSTIVSVGDAALKSARYGGLVSAGYSIGNNTVDLLYGEKTFGEAGVAVAKDTAIGTASSIGVGIGVQTASIALQAVATTKAGIAIAGVASTASTALAGTAIGSTVLAGTAAVGSTLAAGSAVVSGVAATAIGTTLAATTAGAAFVAGAPIVIGAAVVGGAVALGRRLLRG